MMKRHTKKRPARLPAHRWFFPVASIHAAVMVPLALAAMYGVGPIALAVPAGHAYEMLFGFALALVAGYLLGPLPSWKLGILLALWLLARVVHLLTPESALVVIANAAFSLMLGWQLVPRMMAAKKWRNQVIAPLLGLLCLAAVVAAGLSYLGVPVVERWLLRESVQLFALLMLFMGGRILAPAIAGELGRQGLDLEARVQPGLEGALIITVAASFMVSILSFATPVSGLLLIAAGALAAVRLSRWRLWHCATRPDLLCLGAGYGWLALGLMLLGMSKLTNSYPSAALHVITVGGLGTLSTGVMARVSLQKAKGHPAMAPAIILVTVLIGFATLTRAGAGIGIAPGLLLWVAASAWSLAFLVLLYILILASRWISASRTA